jgi:hypothetical protein
MHVGHRGAAARRTLARRERRRVWRAWRAAAARSWAISLVMIEAT